MAHEWHHTKGFILSSVPYGEASRLYHIITPDHGRVIALAQGVRQLASKLRTHLPSLGFVSLSLVRGREFWRITNAQLLPWHSAAFSRLEAQASIARIAQLLRRLIHGEVPLPGICTDVLEACEWLAKGDWLASELSTWEALMAFRIVEALGYGSEIPVPVVLQTERPWSQPLLLEARAHHNTLVAVVNRALEMSQL